MTLKRKEDFGDNYKWHLMTPLGGCSAIIKVAVDNLKTVDPFSDELSEEWSALVKFENNVKIKLAKIMLDEHEQEKTFNPEEVNAMYEAEVNSFVKKLQTQELKNKAYSVLMAACGFIVALLAIAPLVIPVCFSSVRNYVGSFFEAPKVSVNKFQTEIQTALTQLKQLLSNEIECFGDIDKREYSFSNVTCN